MRKKTQETKERLISEETAWSRRIACVFWGRVVEETDDKLTLKKLMLTRPMLKRLNSTTPMPKELKLRRTMLKRSMLKGLTSIVVENDVDCRRGCG